MVGAVENMATPNARYTSKGSSQGQGTPKGGDKSSSSAMAKAMAKMEAQRELQSQRAQELKVGEEWNDTFRAKGNIRNPDVLTKFWAEVKLRLGKKFGSIQMAFRKLDSSGDGQITFLEFCDMMALISMPMDQRIFRQLFDKASGGDRSLSMEELKTLLLGKTIQKLRFVMEGFNSKQERVQTYIHRFVRRLALNDEVSRALAIDRFQRKLTLDFCKDVWKALQNEEMDSTGREPFGRAEFSKAMESFVVKEVGIRLLAYEIIFMERIFDRVDRRRNGSVIVGDFVLTLLMLSVHTDKLAKVAFAFDMFDTDGDGCLLYEQIMPMFLCLCSQRPLVEDNLRIMYDLDFQEELSAQEGRHAYELALWHLQRTIKVEGGTVTKRELIEALERLPAEVIGSLIPGVVRMRWALRPSWFEGDEPPSPVWPPRRTPLEPPSPPCSHPPVQLASQLAAMSSTVKEAQLMMRRISGSVPQLMPPPGRRTVGGPPGFGSANGTRSRPSKLSWKTFDEGSKFRTSAITGFQKSLRSFGDIRLAELTSGFIAPPEVKGDEKHDDEDGGEGGGGTTSSSSGPRHSGGPPGISRSISAPTLARSAGSPSAAGAAAAAAALGSSPGGGSGSSPGGRGGGSPSGKRRSGSAAGAVRRLSGGGRKSGGGNSMSSPTGAGHGGGHSRSKTSWLDEDMEVPIIPADKFGPESFDRFRLYSSATISSGRTWMDRPDPGSNISHKCYVCLGNHRLNLGECSK